MYLVFIDFSPPSLHALGYAACLAEAANEELTLCHSLIMDDSLEDEVDSYIRNKRKLQAIHELERISHFANPKQNLTFNYAVYEDMTDTDLEVLIKERNITLAFSGISGSGKIKKWLFGSRSADIIEIGLCPVIIVPEKAAMALPSDILVAVSGKEQVKRAIEFLNEIIFKAVDQKVKILCLTTKKKAIEAGECNHETYPVIKKETSDHALDLYKVAEEFNSQLVCVVAGIRTENGMLENSIVQRLSLTIPIPLLVLTDDYYKNNL